MRVHLYMGARKLAAGRGATSLPVLPIGTIRPNAGFCKNFTMRIVGGASPECNKERPPEAPFTGGEDLTRTGFWIDTALHGRFRGTSSARRCSKTTIPCLEYLKCVS